MSHFCPLDANPKLKGIRTYTYTTNALTDENYQEHAHTRVCSALTYSVLQCPGVMPGFTGEWRTGPLSDLCDHG